MTTTMFLRYGQPTLRTLFMHKHNPSIKVFSEVVLLTACEAMRGIHDGSTPISVPPGTTGTLVDQNLAFPQVWTIEFEIQGHGIVLVETTQENFRPANPV